MKKMMFAFVAAMLAAFAPNASAQSPDGQYLFRTTDRTPIRMCEPKYLPPDYKELGYRLWTQAGVARLLPQIRGGGKLMLHLTLAESLSQEHLTPEGWALYTSLTDREKAELQIGRIAAEGVIARSLFTPAGTPEGQAPLRVTERFRTVLAQNSVPENIREVIVPCGTVFWGMSNGTHTRNDRIAWNVEGAPHVLGWHEDGVFTEAGVPGVRVLVVHALVEEGHNAGMRFSLDTIVFCGNIVPRLAPLEITAQVEAPALPEPPRIAIPPAPQAEPAPERPRSIPPSEVPEYRPYYGPRVSVSLGGGMILGSVRSTYTEQVPDSGNVPQKHRYSAWTPIVRVEQVGTGFFGSVSGAFLGSTSDMQFETAFGNTVTKIRDTDTSRDNRLMARAGYKFQLGGLTVGPYAGINNLCLCEEYEAQGAMTTTERSYNGFVIGGEVAGPVDSDRLQVRASVEYGPSHTRKAWTHQTYPGVSFPRIQHADESATMLNIRAEAEVRLMGAIHAVGGYDFAGINSSRSNTYTAKERVTVSSLTVGVIIKLGW